MLLHQEGQGGYFVRLEFSTLVAALNMGYSAPHQRVLFHVSFCYKIAALAKGSRPIANGSPDIYPK